MHETGTRAESVTLSNSSLRFKRTQGLPGILALAAAVLAVFLAPAILNAAEVQVRSLGPTLFEVSGGTGSDAWHIRYGTAFLYTYSPRQNTPAKRWADDVPLEEKERRHKRLLQLHQEISSELLRELIGESVEILVEKRSKDQKYLKGLTRCWRNVIFEGADSYIGQIMQVKIVGVINQTLLAIKATE